MEEADQEYFRRKLLEEKQALSEKNDAADSATKPVELDQQSVGRLSRMDAMQGQAMALDQLMTELGNAGITEVNLATTGDTPLGAFTRVLSSLVDQGIDSHWKRTNATTP